MNNPMITSPSPTTIEQQTRKPAYNGLYLVSRNHRPAPSSARPAPSSAQPAPAHRLTLAAGRTSEAPPSAQVEARSAESIRIKLAACFGAMLTAPVIWCLHTLMLSLQTR